MFSIKRMKLPTPTQRSINRDAMTKERCLNLHVCSSGPSFLSEKQLRDRQQQQQQQQLSVELRRPLFLSRRAFRSPLLFGEAVISSYWGSSSSSFISLLLLMLPQLLLQRWVNDLCVVSCLYGWDGKKVLSHAGDDWDHSLDAQSLFAGYVETRNARERCRCGPFSQFTICVHQNASIVEFHMARLT